MFKTDLVIAFQGSYKTPRQLVSKGRFRDALACFPLVFKELRYLHDRK